MTVTFNASQRREGRHLLGKTHRTVKVNDGRFEGKSGTLRTLEFSAFGQAMAEVQIDGKMERVRAELLEVE